MALHLRHPSAAQRKPSVVVLRQFENTAGALEQTYGLDRDQARNHIVDAFVEWLASLLALESDGDQLAREFCRDILSTVQLNKRTPYAADMRPCDVEYQP